MLSSEDNGRRSYLEGREGVRGAAYLGRCRDRRCRVFHQLRSDCERRLHVRPLNSSLTLRTRTLISHTPGSYLVAVHDKRTSRTIFRPAPLHILARRVKRLKSIQPTPATVAQRIEARNALGATFGTKKAQAAIRARERNKIDVDAMKAVTGNLQSTIEGNTTNLPTWGQSDVRNSRVPTP